MKNTVRGNWRSRLDRVIVVLVWGVGYLFGFSLVAIFSFGICHAEEFPVLIHGRKHRCFFVFKEHGVYYLQAQIVATIGWAFVSLVSFFLTS